MVAVRLKEQRDKLGISQEELARKTLCSVRTIARAEQGRGINLNTGKAIARALRIKLEELL